MQDLFAANYLFYRPNYLIVDHSEEEHVEMSRSRVNVQADPSSLARQSSLFDATASYQDLMRKKKEGTTSFVSLAQDPQQGAVKVSKPKILYENTYKLEPDRLVEAWRIREIIEDVLESKLKDEEYDVNSSRQFCLSLTEVIKQRVKELNYARFKVVVTVNIGQLSGQGFRLGSRCLWEPKYDTFAEGSFQNKSLFAVATVFMVYYE